jgi:hypothetical protein
MGCIQDTTRRLSAVEWAGAAPDQAFALLGPVLSRRLHIAAGHGHSCCNAAIGLVAADPADPTLPADTRAALRQLAPGQAVASNSLAELAGGWIAVPGVNIGVGATADLAGRVIAITFADAVAMLRSDGGHRLVVHTTAVVARTPRPVPPGWRVLLADVADVPLAHDHTSVAGHRAGCAA